MASGIEGLASGIERGLRIGATVEGMQQQRELSRLQMQELKDRKKREELRRSNNALLYSLAAMKENPQGYSQFLEGNSDARAKLQRDLQRVGNFAFADTGKAGDVEMIDLKPLGANEQGEMLFGVDVKTKNGKSQITENRGRMSDGDPAAVFTLDQLGQNSAQLDALIAQIEAEQIGMGDDSPLQRQSARQQRAFEKQQADLEFEREKVLRGISAGGNKPPRPYKIGKDEYGNEMYGVYNPQTQEFEPIGQEPQQGFTSLPPDQQRALAIESLQSQRVKPEESTYFGLGDPVYSPQQVSSEMGKLSLGGAVRGLSGTPTPGGGLGRPQQTRQIGDTWTNSRGQTVRATERGPVIVGPAQEQAPMGLSPEAKAQTQQTADRVWQEQTGRTPDVNDPEYVQFLQQNFPELIEPAQPEPLPAPATPRQGLPAPTGLSAGLQGAIGGLE